MSLPPDIPPEVVGFLQEMGYLESDRLQVGDAVPALTLRRLHGEETVVVGDPNASRPTVLIFGSYT
jgi:hypothetical protein